MVLVAIGEESRGTPWQSTCGNGALGSYLKTIGTLQVDSFDCLEQLIMPKKRKQFTSNKKLNKNKLNKCIQNMVKHSL